MPSSRLLLISYSIKKTGIAPCSLIHRSRYIGGQYIYFLFFCNMRTKERELLEYFFNPWERRQRNYVLEYIQGDDEIWLLAWEVMKEAKRYTMNLDYLPFRILNRTPISSQFKKLFITWDCNRYRKYYQYIEDQIKEGNIDFCYCPLNIENFERVGGFWTRVLSYDDMIGMLREYIKDSLWEGVYRVLTPYWLLDADCEYWPDWFEAYITLA